MTIYINTTNTITCENAPVEEVLKELQEKCPEVVQAQTSTVRLLMEDKDRLTRERDEWAKSAHFMEEQFNKQRDELVQSRNETRQERALKEALVSKVADLTRQRDEAIRERDEMQKRLEESLAVEEKLIAENKALAARDDALDGAFETQQMRINRLERKLKEAEEATLAGGSRPALPEGMRLAEHKRYGRVVVSPQADRDGDCCVFHLSERHTSGMSWHWCCPSKLTFLDEEPAPAPLPKPEDCKPGELYLGVVFGRSVVANRSDPKDEHSPWIVSATDDKYADWCKDSQVTLLARLLPDREVK